MIIAAGPDVAMMEIDRVGIPDLGMLVLKLLAVAGGAAVGAVLFDVLLRLVARFVIPVKLAASSSPDGRRQRVPRSVQLGTRLLGAATVGFLVWTWVFGQGGMGGMGGAGGGWWPFGQGKGNGSAQVKDKDARSGAPQALHVHVLGGKRVVEQRFYVLDKEAPRNWDELVEVLAERRRKNSALQVIEIVIYKDSVDRDNPAVTDLEKWAKERGFTAKLSFPERDAP